MTIAWQQTPKRKPRQSIDCPQIATSDFVFNWKKKQPRSDRDTPHPQNTIILLAPIAEHRMMDRFNKHNLVHRFMDPIWRLAKNFGTWIPCFSLWVTTFAPWIWFHNLRTITGSNVWPLCSAHALGHSQAGSAQLAILPLPYLCLEPQQRWSYGWSDAYRGILVVEPGAVCIYILPTRFGTHSVQKLAWTLKSKQNEA